MASNKTNHLKAKSQSGVAATMDWNLLFMTFMQVAQTLWKIFQPQMQGRAQQFSGCPDHQQIFDCIEQDHAEFHKHLDALKQDCCNAAEVDAALEDLACMTCDLIMLKACCGG